MLALTNGNNQPEPALYRVKQFHNCDDTATTVLAGLLDSGRETPTCLSKGDIMSDQHPTQTEIELQAAAYRRLQKHLMEDRTDVQNIDMMNLTGFCRNCLSRWYQEAANERGIEIGKEEARELFYGMTMADWKANYQKEATETQQEAFKTAFAENVGNKE